MKISVSLAQLCECDNHFNLFIVIEKTLLNKMHFTAFRKSAITDLAELSVFHKMEKYDYADLNGFRKVEIIN